MTGNEIRERFLKFFQERGHVVVPSSGLIPKNDPTLLFANAGMNQFKDCFLGLEDRGYYRACSSQKCVRAGGKHNDLENVGRTARHHTFFEMLGNFSFGDYFKKEALAFAWEFLTKDLGLDKNRLYVTVYTDDDEAADIWHLQEGVPRDRIFRFGEKDNFWAMGDTGPCGPCSEIFWDNGPDVGCGRPDCTVGCDCDRFMEIWNNVFMQFNRSADGTLTPLPKPSVDTGMGLERISTVMQGVKSNYDTDLFQGIIRQIEKLSGKRYREDEKDDVSMRVMADHARAMTFLICDGVLPSNEGRGYVLRRIMRRAARHAKMLGFSEPVLYRVAESVNTLMGGQYPELLEREDFVRRVIKAEEERFAETLDNGLRILNDAMTELKGKGERVIPGDILFRLYDTYGFPSDLTADIVAAEGFTIDEKGFDACMEIQRERAREHWKGSGETGVATIYKELAGRGVSTHFVGYTSFDAYSSILAILKDGEEVSEAREGDRVEIVTEQTPFYGESGGQVGDVGELSTGRGHVSVTDAKKPLPELIVHSGVVTNGVIRVGDACDLSVCASTRRSTARNHTATHLLQAALRKVLGGHVNQSGSLVTPERLRFDFTHFSPLTPEEIARVEEFVNASVMANDEVVIREMGAREAIESGATALFDEKYGDTVRVVRVGDVSMELCGGTHVGTSGEIGLFKIVSESGIAAGVRRIEALTGLGALRYLRELESERREIVDLLKGEGSDPVERVKRLLARQKELFREVESLQGRLNALKSSDILSSVREINGVKVLAARVDASDPKGLRELGDTLKGRLGSGIVALGSVIDGSATLLVAVTPDLTSRYRAGDLIRDLAPLMGGRGGGKPELAQAGGDPAGLERALDAVYGMI
ncbi:MAG: alanine--tRNA ligase [Desulfuromonadia bacterium]